MFCYNSKNLEVKTYIYPISQSKPRKDCKRNFFLWRVLEVTVDDEIPHIKILFKVIQYTI